MDRTTVEDQPGVLPVLQSKDETKAFYNKIARVYDLLAERSEQPMRDAGFERLAPQPGEHVLEIGFGNGASLADMAANEPDADFLGIEVHRPGVGRLLRKLQTCGLGNVRVFCHDAVEVLERNIPDACLSRVLLFFPDPWPKKRHHKRRILQPGFAAQVAYVATVVLVRLRSRPRTRPTAARPTSHPSRSRGPSLATVSPSRSLTSRRSPTSARP